ncbi:lasso peptide biosynthesis PqqD family chaperone [Kibdelosporangium philippinense]|uniref:Lasso peptide biosynthesis PqqD family chaperone n=1 Tax=Kibdelosporangium philippinense TaxID=211113 RepID=A0ABS8Z355_9PSEU|nr:lasso peptide biosynthesis PqqD family chaperone [Kibdelosporangium philippinense]MCE7002235.1 lasso peptide biosynthesis PqqD family chaperone [Kibdelosporangium philippinense]
MIRLRERVDFAETDYGTALFDELSGLYWLVNSTGVLALRVLFEGGDIDQAITAVLDRYLVDRDTATRDLHNLLARLREAGLLTV